MALLVDRFPAAKRWKMCWCSCSIRTASIVIAWSRLVCMVLFIIMHVVMLATGWVPKCMDTIVEYTSKKTYLKVPVEMLIGSLAITSLRTILCVLLLFGIHTRKPVFMSPFLLVEVLFISILTSILAMMSSLNIAINNLTLGMLLFLCGFAYVVLLIYLWYVLYSCYCQLYKVTHEITESDGPEIIELTTNNEISRL